MICENCGKEHDGTYGSGRFCSKECARSFSTKNSKGQLKEAKCVNCGKTIYISKRASIEKCRCDKCKVIHIPKSHYKTCKLCGSTYIISQGGCKNQFCKNHNIRQINTLIKYFGFDKTKLGTLNVENEFNRIKNILYDLYWNQGLSSTDIGKIYNYKNSHNIIQQIFNYLKISTRSVSKSIINGYLKGKFDNVINNQYKQQWYTTWNNKEVYLRSSYELDYAKKLDEQKIDYEVEYLHIKYWDSQKQEYRCAIPDFYIPKNNLIIEIKSSWTTNYQELKDKELEYIKLGYNYKLIFEHQEYNSIDDIDKTKYRINNNQIISNNIYKQKDGYNWIYKDNVQLRCSKNDLNKYLSDGWINGRLKYKK